MEFAKNFYLVLLLLTLFSFCLSSIGVEYSRGVVESCSGCSLNRLPDVKKFIFEDLEKYENVEFKHIQGAPPSLVLYDNNDEEVERHMLEALDRKDCNDLLKVKGFKEKKPINDKEL